MLELQHIYKDYIVSDKPFTALKDITLTFLDKGLVCILGPSGCGKTTLLNMIGGLDHYTKGDLLIDGKSTKDFTDREWDGYRNERVGFVFQNYNLIMHMNVISNVEVALMLNGIKKEEREERAIKALEIVGLKDEAKKNPNQLSGGQMQRVALARAIVNNPKIILADEPTGALDSKTSVQVMDLLKEISKDRLVIMVTHNKELADKYNDRIIEMFDGSITKDTAHVDDEEKTGAKKEINKKTSMSFLTAIKSSLQSINTKKTRTILTAVASSFGIIGVALVLAVSNGFQNYVDNVEASVASSVPITISPVMVDYGSTASSLTDYDEYPTDNNVQVYDASTSSYVVHRNKYDQNYIDQVIKPLVSDGLATSYLVNRNGLSFNIVTQSGLDSNSSTYMEVSQYTSAGLSGSVLQSVTSLPATIFHEIYGEEKGIKTMYDLIYGSYPTSANELVLITDKYNRVEASTLKNLGIITSDSTTKTISFKDIVDNKRYKAYPNSVFYEDNPKTYTENVYTNIHVSNPVEVANGGEVVFAGDKTTRSFKTYTRTNRNSDDYSTLYNSGREHEDLRIVGVIRPREDTYINLMPSSIGYTAALKDEFVDDTQTTNVEAMGEVAGNAWWVSSDKDATSNNQDGLDKLNKSVNSLLSTYSTAISSSSSSVISTSDVESIAKALTYGYFNMTTNDAASRTSLTHPSNIGSYLYSNYQIGHDFRENQVGDLMSDLLSKDSATSKKAQTTLLNYIMSPAFYQSGHSGDDDINLMDFVAYFESYSLITSILIFPASLTTKSKLTARLDNYNYIDGNPTTPKDESEQIKYSDIMSEFTSSLSVLIEVISTVLIVFAAISLVVSSVMTGIITYVSVIERTKEIGILRSCGARKKDITRLFEAECSLIGLAAGVIGIAFTYLVSYPINLIIDHIYPGQNLNSIASLNPIHAAILLVLAVILAMISGLIPAIMAAKKDPVVCLRSE
jgi:putative ABC transport system permease protein